jgi:hypothetical protein
VDKWSTKGKVELVQVGCAGLSDGEIADRVTAGEYEEGQWHCIVLLEVKDGWHHCMKVRCLG